MDYKKYICEVYLVVKDWLYIYLKMKFCLKEYYFNGQKIFLF